MLKFLHLGDHKKYILFKRLQSIYSYYHKNIEYVIFPLIFTIGFENQFLRKLLKNDLMDIISNFIYKIDKDDNIIYNIDEGFLADLNKLIYYYNFNIRNPENKKDINPLYKYLCTKKDSFQKPLDLEELYPEAFNYFAELKVILIDYDNKYKNKNKIETEQKNNVEENGTEKIIIYNNKEKNEISTKFSFDITENNTNNKKSNKKQWENVDLSKIKIVNNFIDINFINDLIDERVQKGINQYDKFIKLQKLCENIPSIINDMNLNKNFIETYYKLNFEIAENNLLINKYLLLYYY